MKLIDEVAALSSVEALEALCAPITDGRRSAITQNLNALRQQLGGEALRPHRSSEMTFPKDRQLASAADSDMREAKALCDMQDRDAAPGAAVPAEQTDARPFPEGWKSAAEKPPAPGRYERRYSDGIYAHWWSGEQWSATKDGNAHWRQLADAPYPLWRPVSAPAAVPAEQTDAELIEAFIAHNSQFLRSSDHPQWLSCKDGDGNWTSLRGDLFAASLRHLIESTK